MLTRPPCAQQEDLASDSGFHSLPDGEAVPGRNGEPEQRALLQGAEDARDEDTSEPDDAFQGSVSDKQPVVRHEQASAPAAACSDPTMAAQHEIHTREALEADPSSGRGAMALPDGQGTGANVPLEAPASLAMDTGPEVAEDSSCLPVESRQGDAESPHSAGSLQHIVTQPGSLAAAVAVGASARVPMQTPVTLDSMGAIAHMSPVIPTPFSQGDPSVDQHGCLSDTMQRLPTAAVLPPAHSAGLLASPAAEANMRSNHYFDESDGLAAMRDPRPAIPDALEDDLPAASATIAAAAGAASRMPLADPFTVRPLPPSALLPDPDTKRNGSSVRSTPSPKKQRLMWASDGAASPGRPNTVAASERHAYADTDGDWLSEPESSADSASSRLAKRPHQVRSWPSAFHGHVARSYPRQDAGGTISEYSCPSVIPLALTPSHRAGACAGTEAGCAVWAIVRAHLRHRCQRHRGAAHCHALRTPLRRRGLMSCTRQLLQCPWC